MRNLLAMILVAGCAVTYAQKAEFPLDGTPTWYEITGDGNTTGSVCPVRAVTSRAVIGQAEPGYRFLAFGVGQRWVTLAFQGATAYVPASAAQPVFTIPRPASETSTEMSQFGTTLDEQAKAVKDRAEASKSGSKPLAPNFTNRPTPKPTAMPMGSMGGAGRSGAGGDPAMGGAI